MAWTRSKMIPLSQWDRNELVRTVSGDFSYLTVGHEYRTVALDGPNGLDFEVMYCWQY